MAHSKVNKIEIVTISPIMLGHCNNCEILMNSFGANHTRSQLDEYPQEILDQSLKITEFINSISGKFYISVSIIEAFSVRGLLKLIRFKNRKLPIIIVNGKKISNGNLINIEPLAQQTLNMMTELV